MAIPRIEPYSLSDVRTIAENRVKWNLEADRAALLIHDMQKYFLSFYDPSLPPINQIVRSTNSVKEACYRNEIPVFFSAQPGNQAPKDRALLTDFWGPGLASESHLVDIIEDLKPSDHDTVLTKWRYSAFQRSSLLSQLREQGRDQLIICGIYAHIGILSTALEAFMQDIQVFVVSDGVADFSQQDHEMALNYISQRCGHVLSHQDVITSITRNTEILSKSTMLQDVLKVLDLGDEEVTESDNLILAGLDSIQLMKLITKWKEKVPSLSLPMIAAHNTINDWHQIIHQNH